MLISRRSDDASQIPAHRCQRVDVVC